jgi:hypothetical protein
MLVHKPRGMAFGTDDDMMAMASDLERMGTTFANAYSDRTGQKADDVTALMREDRLMTASEAKDLGYCDEICSPVKMVAAFDMRRLPEKARLAMSAAIEAPDEPENEPPATPIEPEPVAPMPEPAPVTPPAPPPEPVAVVSSAYGDAEIKKTFELCKMLKKPEMAEAFIIAKTPVDKVKDKLIATMAAASDALAIDTTPPETPQAHLDEWKTLQARVKADMGIGRR